MQAETNNNGTLGTVALDSWARGRRVVPHWRFLLAWAPRRAAVHRRRRDAGCCACVLLHTGTRPQHHHYLPQSTPTTPISTVGILIAHNR